MERAEEMYLEWVNDFLTIECFAEYHEITVAVAEKIIAEGRRINHAR